MKIREHAAGKWPQIISALLGSEFTDTRKHQPCPHGVGTDRYRFRDKSGDGSYFCSCSGGEQDGVQLVMCARDCDFKTACELIESVIGPCPKDDRELEPKPMTRAELLRPHTLKTKRSNYLAARGLEVAPGLEWIKGLEYFDGKDEIVGTWPAMLAPVMRGGQFLTYHVTYLDGGRKAPVTPARKILPANGPLSGGACPLYPAGKTLGIAEGIETAIAAKQLFGVPTWAALNTALLAAFNPPDGVERVIVYGDNDPKFAGQGAAFKCAYRLASKGYGVEVKIPGLAMSEFTSGMDWNDWLLSSKETAA